MTDTSEHNPLCDPMNGASHFLWPQCRSFIMAFQMKHGEHWHALGMLVARRSIHAVASFMGNSYDSQKTVHRSTGHRKRVTSQVGRYRQQQNWSSGWTLPLTCARQPTWNEKNCKAIFWALCDHQTKEQLEQVNADSLKAIPCTHCFERIVIGMQQIHSC